MKAVLNRDGELMLETFWIHWTKTFLKKNGRKYLRLII